MVRTRENFPERGSVQAVGEMSGSSPPDDLAVTPEPGASLHLSELSPFLSA